MTKKSVKPAKRIDDRRRSGVGDNVAFTARFGASGLGAGKRISALVAPSIAQHQYTNRGARHARNGKGKKAA